MNKFAESWKGYQKMVTTENGAPTFATSADSNVDLFFTIGALRGQPVDRLYSLFAKAFGENPYIATRVLLWARDVREGAGERKIFRDLLRWLETNNKDVLRLVMPKVPDLGRWDDLIGTKDETVFQTAEFRSAAYDMVEAALRARDGLCAKWMPRKGPVANEMRKHFGLTPKEYRKVLVALSDTVEQKMCAKDWESIDYQKVPSLAQARYSKAFLKNDELRYRDFGEKAKVYAETLAKVESGELDASALKSVEKVKINAAAVYPYDVLKTIVSTHGNYYGRATNTKADLNTIRAQWASLPNYMGKKSILPLVDTSGSMWSSRAGDSLTCADVALSIGLYMASKNRGDFHNMFMTFSSQPDLVLLKGDDIVTQVQQLATAPWGGSTDLAAAFHEILEFARANRVPAEDMPEYLVVLSDMEFNYAGQGKTAYQDYVSQFQAAGYRPPKIVWWNIQSRHDNVPVKFDQAGTALVSGFSPSVVKGLLSGESISPVEMMMRVVMNPRYDLDMVKTA